MAVLHLSDEQTSGFSLPGNAECSMQFQSVGEIPGVCDVHGKSGSGLVFKGTEAIHCPGI